MEIVSPELNPSPGEITVTVYIPAFRMILNVAPYPEVELDTTP